MSEQETEHGREVRAARNQSLFRAVNERMAHLNEAFALATSDFVIACECANTTCIEMITILPDEYKAVRAEPRRFAVLPGHVYEDVENTVSTGDGYVVVEKTRVAGEVAEAAANLQDA